MAAVATWNRRSFGGNPYASISAINTAGGIATSRTTGEVPFFFSASASAITCTGSSNPYDDIEYTWTLEREDGAGGWEAITDAEGITAPIPDASYNVYTDQQGPEAAFVVRDAMLRGGAQTDYRLTLTCRAWNGSAFVSETTTQTITVDPYSGTTYYFDPTSGSDAADGLTTGTAKQTWSALVGLAADSRQFLIKAGETMACDSTFGVEGLTGVRFGRYDAGADPILQAASGVGTLSGIFYFLASAGGDEIEDMVFSSIQLDANDLTESVFLSSGGSANNFHNVYFDNVTATNTGSTNNDDLFGIGGTGYDRNGIGFWNCTLANANSDGQCINFGYLDWGFVFACSLSGDWRTSPVGNEQHHIYWNFNEHNLCRLSTFGTSSGRSYGINGNRPDDTSTDHRYVLIADNLFNGSSGTDRAIDLSNTSNDQLYGNITQAIVEGNAFKSYTSPAMLWYSCEPTIRDNVFFDLQSGALRTGEVASMKAYANLIHVASTGTSGGVIDDDAAAALSTFRFSHNAMESDDTDGILVRADSSTFAGTMDNNQYYAPSDADGDIFADDNGPSEYDFAGWQGRGFDANSTNADPGFTTPASGDFSGYSFPSAVDPQGATVSGYDSFSFDLPDSELTDFSLMLDLSLCSTDWWAAVDTADGTKGRAYKQDDSTELAIDWIDFDNGAETGWARIKWSGALPTTGTIALHLHPPQAASASVAASDTYGSDNAYDSNWQGYWPLTDLNDRTSNGSTLSVGGGAPASGGTGQVGACYTFDSATPDYLDTAGAVVSAVPCTIMLWGANVTFNANQVACHAYQSTTDFIGPQRNNTDTVGANIYDGGSFLNDTTTDTLPDTDTFSHLTARFSASDAEAYINGVGSGTPLSHSEAPTLTNFRIGASRAASNGWDGRLDDVQVHSASRSDAWIKHEYDQTNDPATFWGTPTWNAVASGAQGSRPSLLLGVGA